MPYSDSGFYPGTKLIRMGLRGICRRNTLAGPVYDYLSLSVIGSGCCYEHADLPARAT